MITVQHLICRPDALGLLNVDNTSMFSDFCSQITCMLVGGSHLSSENILAAPGSVNVNGVLDTGQSDRFLVSTIYGTRLYRMA